MNSDNDPNNKDKGIQNDLPLDGGNSFETGAPAHSDQNPSESQNPQDRFFGEAKNEEDDLIDDSMKSFDDDNWDNNDFDSDFNDQNFADEFDDTQQAPGSAPVAKPSQLSSFLKQNFHYVAIGGVAVVGGFLVISTLLDDGQTQTAYYNDSALMQAMTPDTSTANTNNPFDVTGVQTGSTAPVREQQGVPAGADDLGLLMGGDITSQGIQQQVLADDPAASGFRSPSDWGSEQPPMPAPVSKDMDTLSVDGDAGDFQRRQVIDVPVPPPGSVAPGFGVPQNADVVTDASLPETSPEDTTAPLLTQSPPRVDDLTITQEIQATGSDPVTEILAPSGTETGADLTATASLTQAEAPLATPTLTPPLTVPTATTPSSVAGSVTGSVPAQETQSYVENEQIEFLRQNLAAAENRIKAMDNRFEMIMNRLADIDNKVSLMQAGVPVASSSTTEAKDLQTRIKELEKEAKDAKVVSSSASSGEKSFPRTDKVEPVKKATAPAKQPAKKQVKKDVKPDTKKVSPKPSVEIQSPAVPTTSWVLRAAQPNVAWISQGADSPIRKVVVGESVPSLGNIQSVAIENGRWVVRGTQAMITQ